MLKSKNNKNKQDSIGKKKKVIQRTINMDYSNYFDYTLKFKLVSNMSKNPSTEWHKKNRHLWNTNKHKEGNWGCVTGKINDIIGFDPDHYKWKKGHKFYSFMNGRKWADLTKEWDTLTVATPSGGLHYYFKYNDLKNINCSNHEIDIKTDNGYLVGPGSKYKNPDTLIIGKYTVINDSSIKEMPKELYDWLYNNLSYKHNKISQSTKKSRNKKTVGIAAINQGIYRYDFTHAEVIDILNRLPTKYITGHDHWFKTATAMKTIDKVDLFLEYCRSHNETRCKKIGDTYWNKNVQIINSITEHHTLKMIEHILSVGDREIMLDYNKYKPILIPDYEKKPIIIDCEKLAYGVNLTSKDCIFKSDTGTGKTTIVKEYLKKENLKFISIVSRISLADEQYKVFNEYGIECLNYRLMNGNPIINGDNIIITIDSIQKLHKLDFSQYVIFLDEYNSLIEYIITCQNLQDKRIICYLYILRIIEEAQQIIAVDADIHPASLLLIDYCKRDYDFYENTFKHNGGKNSKEIFNYSLFIKQLLKEDKALVATDSKNDAEIIFKDKINNMIERGFTLIGEKKKEEKICSGDIQNTLQKTEYIFECDGVDRKICCITSDNDNYIDLDEYDFVVFSPKIIYGLDSQMVRPVYAHYKENTISPKAMMQQISRSRNLTQLFYIFYGKKFKEEKYHDLDEVATETKELDELDSLSMCCSKPQQSELFRKIYNLIIFNNDCYNTNKFAHAKIGLRDKGFNDRTEYEKTDKQEINMKVKEHKEQKYENFNCNNLKYLEINEYLNLPKYLMKKHKELFIDKTRLQEHFNIQEFFFRSKAIWEDKFKYQNDFSHIKVKGLKSQFIFTQKILQKLGIKRKNSIDTTKSFTKEIGEKFWKEYSLQFRDRGKPLDLTKPANCNKFIAKIYKKLFGKNIVESSRYTSGKNKITNFKFKLNTLIEHRDISKYKISGLQLEDLDLTFGNETSLINYNQPYYLYKEVLQEIKDEVHCLQQNNYL